MGNFSQEFRRNSSIDRRPTPYNASIYTPPPIPVIWDPVTPPEVVVLLTFESSSARSKYMLWLVHTQQCVVSLYLHNQLITLIFKNTKSKILLKTVRKVSFPQTNLIHRLKNRGIGGNSAVLWL